MLEQVGPALRLCGVILLAAFLESASTVAKAQAVDVASCAQVQKEDQTSCREQRKLELEAAKISLEREKLESGNRLEYGKALISALGIGVPIIGVIIAALYARRASGEEERFQFQLKAAEIAMNAENSIHVRVKAQMLKRLFPDALPPNFADDLDPQALRFGPGGPSYRVDLLKLLAAYPEQKEAILRYWGAMFPGDKTFDWFKGLEKELQDEPEETQA